MGNDTFTCAICGDNYPLNECCFMGDQELCPDCLDEETSVCHVCGERLWNDDNAGNDDRPLCQPCYDRHYTNCTHCGALLHNDDAYYTHDDPDEEEPLCQSCHAKASESGAAIHEYSYKPIPIFYGDGLRYFGVELEIDGGGESDNSARQLLSIANREQELAYCKHDGSLNDGFEIVTHPMSYVWHRDSFPWRALLREAASLGYTSHKARTCGLHIHVSRRAFGETEARQDACIARVLYFFERHWEELLKLSRRTEQQLQRWAARYGYKEQPMEILDRAKCGYGGGRYSCINLQNSETVEFRMFRGTLKYSTLLATLQLVDRLCGLSLKLSDKEVKDLSWTSFAASIRDTEQPELVQYLKERRLYINEPVETEVEL